MWENVGRDAGFFLQQSSISLSAHREARREEGSTTERTV